MIDHKKENLIRKINYRSHNRGIKENDIIFSRFCNQSLKNMNIEELGNFDNLLNENDLDIYKWLTKKVECPSKEYLKIINKLSKLNFINDETK